MLSLHNKFSLTSNIFQEKLPEQVLGDVNLNQTKPSFTHAFPRYVFSSIRWPPSPPSAERISHPLSRLGHPLLSRATAVEGIICAEWWSFVPSHMDAYSLCLHSKLAGHQPALVRSHQVVLAQYMVPVSHISVGFIGLGSTWC